MEDGISMWKDVISSLESLEDSPASSHSNSSPPTPPLPSHVPLPVPISSPPSSSIVDVPSLPQPSSTVSPPSPVLETSDDVVISTSPVIDDRSVDGHTTTENSGNNVCLPL